MKLQELLKNIEPVQIIGDADVEVTGVNIDSRKIKEGQLSVAMKGTKVASHKFIPTALELGAKSVLFEDMSE
ncbi:UDP-N-acetylmuramoyl-L-alanyl-D-glutamate--2,6-diaminopimelate ligase, partial [Pseudomonas frederiksbergensis]|nr:UDP-N-acetylmuramoyl-L-alanyl-D-glutamate--2,6-diaminopimelate ligase [Pseudomonas frederiksbergensis]